MCGIVGYVGYNQAAPLLLKGLEKLEYRGYDSAGLAVINEGNINVKKAKGRLNVLSDMVNGGKDVVGNVGIGHTRWATHGKPSDKNAHPQLSNSGNFAVVHNGIIENYMVLKEILLNEGVEFSSETDTEVVAQLLDFIYNGDIIQTILNLQNKIEGSYSLAIICNDYPDKIFVTRKDSPLVIGIGKNENYIASDIPAILSTTRDMYRLEDREIACIEKDKVTVFDSNKNVIEKNTFHVDWDVKSAEKSGFDHFMFKEITEQPNVIRNTISPRIKNGEIVLDDIKMTKEDIKKFNNIFIIACGSAYHVGVSAKYIIEKTARIPVEVDLASEFRYRSPIIDKNALVIVISQSGETADTLAAMREAKKLGARVLSIVNVVSSTIACESDDVLYTWAGPEIAVATTKAYSAQLCVIYLLAIYMAKCLENIDDKTYKAYINELMCLPDKVQKIIDDKDKIFNIASNYFNCKSVFFMGRSFDYAISLEGSLKLKEISYINSEAYAAGELKHGTISLIEDGTLVVAISTEDRLFDKMVSNVKEVKSRGATVLAVTKEKNVNMMKIVDESFCVPDTYDIFSSSLSVIPLQLFAYYVALNKGCDIDKPRNLAKSVTVE